MKTADLLTPADVALRLRVSLKVVYALANAGSLVGSRVGRQWRFSIDDVNRFLARQRHTAPQRHEEPATAGRRLSMPGKAELDREGADTFL